MVARLNFLDESAPAKTQPNSAFGRNLRFFILLLLAGFIVVLCESFLLYSLRKEGRSLSEQLSHLEAERDSLETSFVRMTDRLESEEEKLSFITRGAGAVEILSVLAFLRTEGVMVDKLRLSEKELVLEGRSESPQRAQAFAAALSVSGLFSSAGEPIVTDSAGDGWFSFTFTGKTPKLCSLVTQKGQD